MKIQIMHYQDLAALYAKWAMLFRDAKDNESAKWAQKLSACYAQTARFDLVKLVSEGYDIYE